MIQDDKFQVWYHEEWMPHIRDSGGIQAQIKLLTWMVGALLAVNVALIGFLVSQAAS